MKVGDGSGNGVSCEEGGKSNMLNFIPGRTGSRLSAFEGSQTSQLALLGSSMSTLGAELADDWLVAYVFCEKLRSSNSC